MARPRWHEAQSPPRNRIWRTWDRFVALWAALNLLIVAVDATYLPFRSFWLRRTVSFPAMPLAVSLPFLPDITPWMDARKGMATHQATVNDNGLSTVDFWQYDLVFFQSVFLLDLVLQAIRLRRKLPGLSWRDAVLRRWIDLPLFLPFWRWLRLAPVLERLQREGLINLEPLRAVISRGVVALLALELFEVLALQIVDGVQQQVRSKRWPMRLRALRSHQTVMSQEEREVVELLRLWAPLLLVQVAPRLAPELQGVLGHAMQQSLQTTLVPAPLRQLQPLLEVEQGFSKQLAQGMVESLLDLSRGAGLRLGRRDDEQLRLLQHFIDRFWEELALALEQGPALERSQELVCAALERLKRTYLSQISRAGIEGLIEELDQLMNREGEQTESDVAPTVSSLPPGEEGL